MAHALENDEDFDIDAALDAIAQMKTQLKATYENYQKSCPPDAEAARACMSDSVTLYYGALTHLEEFIDTCEDSLIAEARAEAEQAGRLLNHALDWVQSVAEANNPQQLY